MSQTSNDETGWTVVQRKKRKTKTGTALETIRKPQQGSKQPQTGPSWESLKARLDKINQNIATGKWPEPQEGRVSDLHLAVSQSLIVRKDMKPLPSLLNQLEKGLEKMRREILNEEHGLDTAYQAVELTKNRYFDADLDEQIKALDSAKADFLKEATTEGALKFNAALQAFDDAAKLSCEKWKQANDKSLQEILSQTKIPKSLEELHKELTEESAAFDDEMSSEDYILAAANCKDVDGLLRGYVARSKFDELPEPVGEGIWKINAVQIYKPPGPFEAPGNGFDDVCPGQDFVNRQIVEFKLANKLPATPVVPVVVTEDGKLALQDKHHTFVACMALGRPVKLALTSNPMTKAKGSWRECTWKGFEKPGAAGAGFSVPEGESAKLEGASEATPDWEKTVPWRKDVPETDEGKVNMMVGDFTVAPDKPPVPDKPTGSKLPPPPTLPPVPKELKNKPAITEQLAAACEDDPGLAKKLFEILKIGAVKVSVRKKPEKSTGGDWDAAENTIYLDDDLGPLDMIDMLVWEAHNAHHQIDFSKLQHDAYSKRMGPEEVGKGKAKIEAKTEIDYLEHLLARKKQESDISGNGQKHIDGIDKAFKAKGLKPYSEMDNEERLQNHAVIEEIFIATPHDATKTLPDRAALKSGELYAYEHVADTQNVKGVTAFFRDKISEDHPKKRPFMLALRDIKDSPQPKADQPPKSWAGLFYDIVSVAANKIFDLKVVPFSAEQKQVATQEATGQSWSGALTQALTAVETLQIETDAPTEDTAQVSLTPRQVEYMKTKNRLDQSGVMLIRETELGPWAWARGIKPREAVHVRTTIEEAEQKADQLFNPEAPTEEEYENAVKILQDAVKVLDQFEETLRSVKSESEEEQDFREQLKHIDQTSVLQVPSGSLNDWAKQNQFLFSKVNRIRNDLEGARKKAYDAIKTDGEAKPSPEAFTKAADFLKAGLIKFAEFEKR